MTTYMPLVTIGLPVYNGARFLPRALDSLLAQDYPNFELILSDNCSTDATADICSRYAAHDSRIRFSITPANIGAPANFYKVLSEARGDYFMFAADDDHWSPAFISTLVRDLEQYPNCHAAMCAIECVTERSEPLRVLRYPGEYGRCPNDLSCLQLFKEMQYGSPFYLYLYGLFRRRFLRRVLRKPWPDVPAADMFLLAEVGLATPFRYVDEVLYTRTVHSQSAALRYPEEGASQLLRRGSWTKSDEYRALNQRILRSPVIPWFRKLAALLWLRTRSFDLRTIPGGPLILWLNRVLARTIG